MRKIIGDKEKMNYLSAVLLRKKQSADETASGNNTIKLHCLIAGGEPDAETYTCT
jgi:hypothetical protein